MNATANIPELTRATDLAFRQPSGVCGGCNGEGRVRRFGSMFPDGTRAVVGTRPCFACHGSGKKSEALS